MQHQIPILLSDARFKLAVCGRRWGKTVAGLIACLAGHGPQDGSRKGAIHGKEIWWAAPTNDIANPIWRMLKAATRDAWETKSEVQRRIELPGGGAVTVKSADEPDALRGEGLDGIVLDEAASMKPEVWNEAVRPALSDKLGWGLFIGTPKGLNWYWELFEAAAERDGWQRWQEPTSRNPIIPPEEIDAAKADLGSLAFLQEYLAQFVTAGAGMFQWEWFRLIQAAPAGLMRVRAWDMASTEAPKRGQGDDPDWTVGVLMGRTPEGRYVIMDVTRLRGTPQQVEAAILNCARHDGPEVHIAIEQEPGASGETAAQYLVRRLAGYTVHCIRPTGPKPERARPLSAQAEAGNVSIVIAPWNLALRQELVPFPVGLHDDQADACSLAFSELAKVIQPSYAVGQKLAQVAAYRPR